SLADASPPPPSTTFPYTTLFRSWTGSKTELIELLYALHSSKCINSGTTDIKELAAHFEHFYNVDLGNYYHTFIDIRSRKSSRTRFLERLIEMLNQRMESLEE